MTTYIFASGLEILVRLNNEVMNKLKKLQKLSQLGSLPVLPKPFFRTRLCCAPVSHLHLIIGTCESLENWLKVSLLLDEGLEP